jgi:hypothetical protein
MNVLGYKRVAQRGKPKRSHIRVCCLCLLSLLANPAAKGQAAAQPPDAPQVLASVDVYRYRMKGSVRVIFFWIGRDDVGGGRISFLRVPAAADGSRLEGTEVLFGSRPDRVPGRINRWGYGKELTYWREPEEGPPCVEETLFEGFMRHSSEQSLSDVRTSDRNEKSENLFWYDGIRSRVSPERAETEIVYFSRQQDFDYNNFQPVVDAYQNRRAGGPPDKRQALTQASGLYAAPLGFISAVREILRAVSERFQSGDSEWREGSYALNYAYNAKAYRLRVARIRHYPRLPEKFWTVPPSGLDEAFQNVAEAEFELSRVPGRDTRKFLIWFPMQGAHRGIPLRIVDRPRWWLQVELNLQDHFQEQAALDQTRFADIASIQRSPAGSCISPRPQ